MIFLQRKFGRFRSSTKLFPCRPLGTNPWLSASCCRLPRNWRCLWRNSSTVHPCLTWFGGQSCPKSGSNHRMWSVAEGSCCWHWWERLFDWRSSCFSDRTWNLPCNRHLTWIWREALSNRRWFDRCTFWQARRCAVSHQCTCGSWLDFHRPSCKENGSIEFVFQYIFKDYSPTITYFQPSLCSKCHRWSTDWNTWNWTSLLMLVFNIRIFCFSDLTKALLNLIDCF